ncbi:hypothetical protein FB567DRAFT_595952 [Paraphoma chrysanthemicola]|uniref:Uncharacterized protein n=1 Tax=Paraphoma chrysanthemicola TaxID=798071 RepID=A0A8K0VUF7_9PLEO|nr:hypothetical protein FB567DRAFT_595952 [Paraphoma chrysanthemicola]
MNESTNFSTTEVPTNYAPYVLIVCLIAYFAIMSTMLTYAFRYRTSPDTDIEQPSQIPSSRILMHDPTPSEPWGRERLRAWLNRPRGNADHVVANGFDDVLPKYSQLYEEVDDDELAPPPAYDEIVRRGR